MGWFNDTTYEKAEVFKDKKLFLAVAVWTGLSELQFIVYGQNPAIGDFLATKIDHFKAGNTVRSTQSISIKDLVVKYGFKIISPIKTKREVQSIFRLKYRGADWWSENIIE